MTHARCARGVVAALVASVALFACDPLQVESSLGKKCSVDADCPGATCGVAADGAHVCVPVRTCSSVDFGLSCAGDTLVGCGVGDEVLDVDCTHFFLEQPTPELTCGEPLCNGACSEVETTHCMGQVEGDVCTDPLVNMFDTKFKALCPEGLACVLEAVPQSRVIQHCRVEPQECNPGDAGFCTEDDRALNCFANTSTFALPPSAIDCAGFAGGHCVIFAGDGSAVCLVSEGAVCDGAAIQCGDGLTCVGFDRATFNLGLCQPTK